MYHCRIQFYFTGSQHSFFETIKSLLPLEGFEHEYTESDDIQKELLSDADVIFADISEYDNEKTLVGAVNELISGKKKDSELILLAKAIPDEILSDRIYEISDIWLIGMSEAEKLYRIKKWQQAYKTKKDYWQTNQFFETTINSTPNLIWFKNKNGIHEKVNDSFCKTVNKSKKQVEGKGHAYIWDVEHDDPACIESENVVMRTGKTCISEETISTGEGMRLLSTYKSPLYNIDGSVMGTVGVAIDITRERAYEQEIIKKTKTLEKMFTSMDCGIMCHSLDGSRILSINQAALKILGYETQDEMMTDGFNMVAQSVLDEDKEYLRGRIRTLKTEGDSISVEYRVRNREGNIQHVMGNVKLLKENGELFYQRFLLDCTAQKMQEKENERRQLELVQALTIDFNLVCFFDLNTGEGYSLRVNDCDNHVLKDLFTSDLILEDNIGRYIDACVYKDDKEMMRSICCKEGLKKELSEKIIYSVNYRTLCNGKLRYFQMKGVRTGKWGDNHSVVLGFRSVDDEIRIEMEKNNLLENALMQANRASKAKSVFLSNMSHDIRTPMNAIVGFTSLALTHLDSKERTEECLKKIMTSGNHLLSLINDVLDMSRIESGKMHLEEKPCSLPEILHGLKNILQADIHAKQLELYIDTVDVIDEEICCDKLRLNQVLLNLLSNAVKYTGPGGTITVRITEKAGAPKGFAFYEFTIKDTGIGMSEEFVSHIFEPFERERNSTISGIQGTGLGMAITKNIVDMMNGSIQVKSEQMVGTECTVSFTFRLNSEAKETQTLPELNNFRALVVDDDFNTCDSVTYMLQQLGMRAEWTLSGKEAVLRTRQAMSRGDDYKVYLIDYFLPDMNGIEVVRRIRKETGENVPVIVITAYDWAEFEEEAREAGVSAFCSKPLFLSELRSCLHSIAGKEEESKDKHEEKAKKDRTGRILLAEDNELNQEIAVAILNEAGFEIEVAENGKIAVEMLENHDEDYYQLILMDVQMPVMNGYEATRKIRMMKNNKIASIPILAMTANAFEEDKQEAMMSGMNGHISKPIDVQSLLKTLDEVMEQQ